MIPFLSRVPWRLVGLAAIAAGALWALHSYGERRYDAGKAHVQAKWDADEAEEKRVADEATRKAELEDAADEARNAEILAQYNARVAAADRERDRVSRLLRQARAAADSLRAGQGSGVGGAAEASETGSLAELRRLDERVREATAALRVEAQQNADQLDAVLAELVPQM